MGFYSAHQAEQYRRSVVEAMDCQKFLARFSDFLDGDLDDEAAGEMERHRSSCERCRRYARTLQSGIELLRSLPPLDVPRDFHPRLDRRLFSRDDQGPDSRSPLGSGATLGAVLSVAALVAIAAWAPSIRLSTPIMDLPAVVVAEPPAASFTPAQPRPTFPRNLSLFTTAEFQDGIWGDPHKLLREYSPILEHRRSQPLLRVGIE
ncbi:MAG: zf-HC2 domain-containing protein [Gemmatimonadota bacterium]